MKEEFTHALTNKILIQNEKGGVMYNQTDAQRTKTYRGYFSDGQRVKIIERSYEWQNEKLYKNYIGYIEIE